MADLFSISSLLSSKKKRVGSFTIDHTPNLPPRYPRSSSPFPSSSVYHHPQRSSHPLSPSLTSRDNNWWPPPIASLGESFVGVRDVEIVQHPVAPPYSPPVLHQRSSRSSFNIRELIYIVNQSRDVNMIAELFLS